MVPLLVLGYFKGGCSPRLLSENWGPFLLLTQHGMTSEQRTFKDFESFQKSLNIGISEKRSIDINNDGIEDMIVFSSGGEETFLTLLIRQGDHYVATGVPVGLEYDILGRKGNYYLKVGTGTFPMFGDIHGPDKYNWYDFFRIDGTKLVLINESHPSFYEGMIPIYQSRISEIENETESQKKNMTSQGNDPEVVDAIIRLKRDHIERYREFIKQAKEIVAKNTRGRTRR